MLPWCLGFLASCQVPVIPEEHLPVLDGPLGDPPKTEEVYQSIQRQEVIRLARQYASHRWTPSEANVWHGVDSLGVQVDTPDASFRRPGIRRGWWQVGVENQGIPYQWGGFSSIEEFDAGLAQGYAAGDVLTPAKQIQSSQGIPSVSLGAVGIGSSGFVSRCWGLSRNHSTRELSGIANRLDSYEDLLPGDILNLSGVHVILFEQFADDARKGVLGYEAGSPPSWKVLYDHLPVSHLKRLGYVPMRYRMIESAEDDAAVLGLRSAAAAVEETAVEPVIEGAGEEHPPLAVDGAQPLL